MDLSREKGASSWLTVLPLEEHHFSLHKQAFRDALALRYGWLPSQVPSNCPCGHSFSTQHVLSCQKGGYPSIRHNELRDFTASLLSETCHGVAVEPSLQPVTSESLNGASANRKEGARLDIVASGFWGSTFERAFFDVRVFNPLAPSNSHSSITATYRQHEREKKRRYEQRIREIKIPLSPLWFSRQLVALPPLQPRFTKGWLQCSQRNGINHTVPPSDGCDAGYLFPSSDPPSCALEEQGHLHTDSSLS